MRTEKPHTRRQLADFLTAEGYPVTPNQIAKARHAGTGPEPFAKFGRRHLFMPSEGLRWAKSLVKPIDKEAS
jgi:hypothetical protein